MVPADAVFRAEEGEVVLGKGRLIRIDDFRADKVLEDAIKQHVKSQLEAHAYPREIEFLEEMPMTDTGKIIRPKAMALAMT